MHYLINFILILLNMCKYNKNKLFVEKYKKEIFISNVNIKKMCKQNHHWSPFAECEELKM